MVARPTSETKRIRYLLGLSSQAEREHIESQFFKDDDAFQEMLTAEDDLFDAYARDDLTTEERRIFETKFLTSWRSRDRLRFARAFAGTVSGVRPLDTKPLGTLVNIKALQGWQGALRVAMIAAVFVIVTWLVNDRRRLTNEIRTLRTESAALGKETEALRHSVDTQRTRTAEITAQLENLQAPPDKPRPMKGGTTASQRTALAPEVNNRREVANRRRENEKKSRQQSIMDNEGASLGNTSFRQQNRELPIQGQSAVGLLTLDPDSWLQRLSRSNRGNIITVPTFLRWIILQLDLETVARHTEYRVTIKTTNARLITSVNWIEALTPNQTRLDTPTISTVDFTSGDYTLLLEGKESNGTYVKVAEYFFKVNKS